MNNENEIKKDSTSTTANNAVTDTIPKVAPSVLQKTVTESVSGSLSEGFNLMPKMTAEQKAVETTKATFNIGSALGLIALAVVSLFIVGFNIISKQQLNQSKKTLFEYENSVSQKVDLITANAAIVDRLLMYENVRKNTFSHKEVIDFIQAITIKSGNIELRGIEITDTLTFTIDGSASNLEDVSRLWYLLGINENIETVNLESVGKNENGARFSFEGKLVSSKFIKS